MAPTRQVAARIASASGSVTDRRHALADIAEKENVQYIVGDWLSEYNMTMRGSSKVNSQGPSSEFERTFLEAIEPALPLIESRHIKVVVNAGASDTKKLHEVLTALIDSKRLSLQVAWIEGDEVLDAVQAALSSGEQFKNLTNGRNLSSWGFEPIYAQCYLGSFGIVEALKHGADVVLCGRVADASPTIGCAAYHHGWTRQDYAQLAHSFVAGHLIECSTYVTGGNFTGFKSIPGPCLDLAFPIAEINPDGDFYISKQKGKDGMVTAETCKAQLLYEIQGPYYYNSDVVAILDQIEITQAGENRVFVNGVGFMKPPPTTKVGITGKGGYQAEVHYFICGLDVKEKAAMVERQVRHLLDESRYHCLKFRINGSCPLDPANQDSATVDLRIFAQSKDESALSTENFFRRVTDNIMQTYPGATFAVDTRQAAPKPYFEYWTSLIAQAAVKHICHLPYNGLDIEVDPPTDASDFVFEQPSYETKSPIEIASLGPTTRAPLGHIVHARSGDKGSDCNVGFFVRNSDEWDWLRSVLTIDKIRELLAEDDTDKPIFRFELPKIWAVHFLLKDHLDRGVSSSSTYDVLGKNLAEYLRCKRIDVPNRFLDRGII